MNILNRLKLELSNKQYFTDDEYIQLLSEEGLNHEDIFNKSEHYKQLLYVVLNILQMVSNDTDLMRKINDGSTEFSMSQAYTNLSKRIHEIQLKINSIADKDNENSNNIVIPFIL